jgi:hypothetical protein
VVEILPRPEQNESELWDFPIESTSKSCLSIPFSYSVAGSLVICRRSRNFHPPAASDERAVPICKSFVVSGELQMNVASGTVIVFR